MEFPNDPNHFPNTVSGIGIESTTNKNEVYKKPDIIFSQPLKPLQPSLFKETEISMERTNLMNQLQGIQERKQDLILKDMMEKLEFQRQQEKIARLNAMLNNYYFTSFLDELQDKIKLSQNKRLDELQKEMLESNEETKKINQNLMNENQKKSAEYWKLRQEGKTHEEILTMREKEKSLSMKKQENEAEISEKIKEMMNKMTNIELQTEETQTELYEEIEQKLREEYEKKMIDLEQDASKMIDETITETQYREKFFQKDVQQFNKKITPILKKFDNQIDVLEKFDNIEKNLQEGKSVDKILSKKLLSDLNKLTNETFNLDFEELLTESKKGSGSERRIYFNEMKNNLNAILEENNFNLELLQEGRANLEELFITKQEIAKLKDLKKAEIKLDIQDRLGNFNDYKELYPYQFGVNR